MFYREAGHFHDRYREDMAIFPIREDRIGIRVLLAIAFVAVPLLHVAGVPPFAGDYLFSAVLVPLLILSVAGIGLNLLVGYCGQISLGAGAFMGVGAYAAYDVSVHLPGMPLIATFLLAGAASAVIGLVFGMPSLRIKGLYLAVATLAAQFFLDWAFLRVGWITNYSPSGSVTAPALAVAGWQVDTPVERYLLVLAIAALVALGASNLVRGNLGRQWMAIRDMDIAAEIIGIRPVQAKLTAFAVSSFILGLAGALWAFVNLRSWEPYAFSIDRSFQLLFLVIIGGLGSIIGCFLGAAFIWLLPLAVEGVPRWLSIPISADAASNLTLGVFGALILLTLIFEPHGLARIWAVAKHKLRRWPFPY
ncbi:branched-chain amino acid ABC transporter permease [Xanthobacter dioxanivorans]|uniref:Branched-chain amino acid ABC transporter permease n=1 Tax=Xanthobacter dioxanivorans TaxID=2528964 RepID=A0A974PP68_9HYPH|nr:branched-chain amino acid ABC transporter permease [Xanthobacter dioxanivorans]QRG06799.1 branched-chain amino acid ABC transporter permease [Xanthobacter dioxanivorans]